MKEIISITKKNNFTFLLAGMCIFCFALFVFRSLITHTPHYFFLNWNLFLAGIPWVLSVVIISVKEKNALLNFFLFILWLLFFPNSLYIITDLFHLRNETAFPIWYDLILITSFAWAGLMMGFSSLINIRIFLIKFLPVNVTNLILAALLFLGSFGVYVGRYLRWNSWDLIANPLPMMIDIKERIAHPMYHTGTWGMTLLLGFLLNMMFWTFIIAFKNKQSEIHKENHE
ncbi:MAG: DUF1361 domain-containing protein [Bacteroidota bacterium]